MVAGNIQGAVRAFLRASGLIALLGQCMMAHGQDAVIVRTGNQTNQSGNRTILEQIEQDIANIVRQSRGGIVTIQDMRALASNNGVLEARSQRGSNFVQNRVPGTQKSDAPRVASGGANEQTVPPKSGTGFSIGDGYIVTTADVAEGMVYPIITTDCGDRFQVRLVAQDVELNVALMRLLSPEKVTVPLPALRLGTSADTVPGNFAICIGNQVGQLNSAVWGTISGIRTQGLDSANHFYPNLLQIGGIVGAGTSGAPVLNARGEVIGMMAAALESENEAAISNQSMKILNAMVSGSVLNNSTLFSNNSIVSQGGVQISRGQTPPTQNDGSNTGTSRTRSGRNGAADNPNGSGQRSVGAGTNSAGTQSSQTQSPQIQSFGGGIGAFSGQAQAFGSQSSSSQIPGSMTFRVVSRMSSSGGFAIPVDVFKGLLESLKSGQNIVHAWLGVDLEEISEVRKDERDAFIMKRTVQVGSLYREGPAAKYGVLRTGDLFSRINGHEIQSANDVRRQVLLGMKPGDRVKIDVVREGRPLTVELLVEARPAAESGHDVTIPSNGQQSSPSRRSP